MSIMRKVVTMKIAILFHTMIYFLKSRCQKHHSNAKLSETLQSSFLRRLALMNNIESLKIKQFLVIEANEFVSASVHITICTFQYRDICMVVESHFIPFLIIIVCSLYLYHFSLIMRRLNRKIVKSERKIH